MTWLRTICKCDLVNKLRYSHDIRTTFALMSHECFTNIMYFFVSQFTRWMSLLCRNFVSNHSQCICIGREPLAKLSCSSRTSWLTETYLGIVRDGLETQQRRLCDYFEKEFCRANLRIFLSCSKFMRQRGDTLRITRGNWEPPRMFQDTFETLLRMPFANLSQVVAAQWDTGFKDQ